MEIRNINQGPTLINNTTIIEGGQERKYREMKLDKSCTYSKWYIHSRRVGYTITVYKTRYCRPNWWPKNISSPGYEETIELAAFYYSLQLRYVVGHFIVGMYFDHMKWNEDVKIKFIDKLRVWWEVLFIACCVKVPHL